MLEFSAAKECREYLEVRSRPVHFKDPFTNPDEWAKLEYGRLLWKNPRSRKRLLDHWTDERHPYRDRFLETYRPHVIRAMESHPDDDEKLDAVFREIGLSLRVVVKEIPPVFGSFW